jgi:hypothetical protein
VPFGDTGEADDAGILHVYIATYDGANIKTYQDGVLINTVPATGDITHQDATHTRVGSYHDATDGTIIGARDMVLVGLLRRDYSSAQVTDFSADPWQVFKADSGAELGAEPGAFSVAGQSIGLRAQRKLAAGVGAFALAGQSINAPAQRVLGAGNGSFTLSGQSSNLRVNRNLPAGTAAFALNGYSISLKHDWRMTIAAATFVTSGNAIAFRLVRL